MKTSILSVNLIARMLMLLCSVSSASIAFAQSVSIEFLPNGNANSDFEILQYELLPDYLSMSDVDRSHTIRHRMFTKTLSGEWIGGKEESMLGEEELFVRDLISTFNNLTDVTELETLLDEESYTRKLDEYASYQNQVRFDKVKYADWTDTRPFAVVRYGNVYVIICDIRKEGMEGENEYETEIIKAIHHQGKYQLTESLDQADSYDGIINGYLNPGMAEGRILNALRNRAGMGVN